ncbi:MAG: hypothetical protein ACK6D3_13470 [Planctomycetaceae bacterium]
MSSAPETFGTAGHTPITRWRFLSRCGLAVLALRVGCGRVRPITGGTPGTLQVPNQIASDLQLTFFREEAGTWQPVGFATTGEGGRFELLLPGATGPLRLEPGLYRVTVQTAGSELVLPPEVGQVATTPVQIEWTGKETGLQLSLPLAR